MIVLPAQGYVQVHAYASNAQIPLKDVSVTITDQENNPIAFRLTNRSGLLETPFAVSVPDASASQSPGSSVIPYTSLNLYARKEDYEQIVIKNLQVFPNVITNQDLEMIPLGEFPESWNQSESFDTFPQSL